MRGADCLDTLECHASESYGGPGYLGVAVVEQVSEERVLAND